MNYIRGLFAVSALFLAGQVHAAPLNIDPRNLTQPLFNALSDDLAAATWMTPSNSAESHSAGIIPIGIQTAIELTGLSINPNATHWALAGATGLPSRLPIPRLRISAGIPFGLDVGYMITSIPNSNVKITGYEGRMAFGNYIPVPMLEANIRIHQSSLTGVPNMELKNSGYAVMAGMNLPIVNPYIEFGRVTSTSTPSGVISPLAVHKTTNNTMAVGAKVELALFIINLEKSKVGDKDLMSLKLGFEF